MSDLVDLRREKAKRATENHEWTVEDCLEDALEEVRSGERQADGVLILFVDRTDKENNQYSTGWQASHLRSTEMIALMEAIKVGLLRDMGFT